MDESARRCYVIALVRRKFVIDDAVGTAPALLTALPIAAFLALMSAMPPIRLLGGLVASAVGYAAFWAAGWRFLPRLRWITIDDDGVAFAAGRRIEHVDRSEVASWGIEIRGADAVIVARDGDERARVVLSANAQAAPYLRRIVEILEAPGTARPEGGYRQAPGQKRRRRDSVEMVRWPAHGQRHRVISGALVATWSALWMATAIIFELDGPEIPWLAFGASALGCVALAGIARATLPEPRRASASWWARLRLPRNPRLAWPLAASLAVASGWCFFEVTRPLDFDANRRDCDRGRADACWYAASLLLRDGHELEAMPYLERACHAGRGRACSYRTAWFEEQSAGRALAMLEQGCRLDDVTSCTHLESHLTRVGDRAGAKAAHDRKCALDPRLCATPE